jgi:hypothetical protein
MSSWLVIVMIAAARNRRDSGQICPQNAQKELKIHDFEGSLFTIRRTDCLSSNSVKYMIINILSIHSNRKFVRKNLLFVRGGGGISAKLTIDDISLRK